MALNLNDFKTSALSLTDFQGQLPIGKTPNERSAKVIAAGETIAQGGEVEAYEAMKARLLDPTAQGEFTMDHQRMRDGIWENFINPGIPDIITDPSIAPEEKDSLINTALIPQDGSRYLSSASTLAYQAAVADSGEDVSDAAEEARFKMIGSIDRVNNDKRRRQAGINGLKLGNGIAGTLVDIGELMVPFAEWVYIDQLQKQLGDSDASWYESSEGVLLGEQKRNLYESIQAMPMEQRQEFTEKVLDGIQNNRDVLLPDGNDMVALETLNRMLLDNDYSNVERWFDNITSLLDIVGIGAAARAPKAAKGASRAAGATQDAQSARRATGGLDGEVMPPMDAPAVPTGTARLDTGMTIDGTATDISDTVLPAPTSRPQLEYQREAMAEVTRTDVAPASPSQIVKDVNPGLAREMHARVLADPTEETAEALYGTSKLEVVAKDVLPEPEIKAGRMQNKVEMYPEDMAVREQRLREGHTAVTEAEWGKVQQKLTAGVRDVEGMVMHPSSLVIRTNADATLGVTARYSPVDSGFRTWQEALTNAKYAFRQYGLQDENFTLLARNGDEWVETTPKEANAKELLKAAGAKGKEFEDIDYAIGMKYDYRFRPEDLEIEEVLTTAPGLISRGVQFLDRSPTQLMARMGQGSLVQNLLDPASVIHPTIVNPGHVAVDRAVGLKKLYQETYKGFTDKYKKLPKERRALVGDYIHQANLEGLKLDVIDLRNRGFDSDEIAMLKEWRRANDTMWYAANDDMGISLRAKGVQVYTHDASGTKLFGTPVARTRVNARSDIFDSADNTVGRMTIDELDEFYEKGGQIIALPEPAYIDGRWVDMVKVRNTPNGGYLRAIYEGEVVMPYRDGYYPVMYDANFFVEKTVRMADGTTRQKVVAAARDSGEVEQALTKLRASDPEGQYSSRKDRRFGDPRDQIFDEGSWSHITNVGMSSQKVRGERLGDAGNDLHKMGNAHLKDPLEAVANQIHTLSQRVSMRNYMETVKNRWMQSYSQHLDLPINERTGKVDFPAKVNDIVGKEGVPAKLVADARTNFNYLYSLQNGYINGMDSAFKAIVHGAAELAGGAGFNKAERHLLEGAKGSPTRMAKTAAFKLFISSNPLRQAVIQRGQLLQLGVANPQYFATGQMVSDLVGIDGVRMGLVKKGRYADLWDEIKNSGIVEAVDAHTLLREDQMRLADLSLMQKAGTQASRPLDYLQRVGFDYAEQDILISAWLAFRDKALKAGKDIKNQRVQDEILGEARAFTGGMNRAGDMPYSNNTLALAAQFFSFRHKMLLQPLTNRALTPKKRAQLLAYNAALFGVNATIITSVVNQLFPKEDPSGLKDVVSDGLLDVAFNKGLSMASGTEQAIDWGDLAPTEAYGLGNMFIGMLTTDLSEMIASSPAGSLMFGANPRIHDAMKTAMRYFNVADDYSDEELATTLPDVAIAAANLFSGFTNTFKARYAYQTGRKLSTSGSIPDEEITRVEAALGLFGFQTKTESGYRETYEQIFGSDYSGMEDDVKDWYRELKRQLARSGTTTTEDDISTRIMQEAWTVFGDERPRAMETIVGEIEKDAMNGDYKMLNSLIRKVGMVTEEDMWKIINKLPAGPVRENITTIMNVREESESGN